MEESDKERICKRIVELRKELGITQTQLAEMVNIKRSNLARIESGKHSTGIDAIIKIANALGKRLDIF